MRVNSLFARLSRQRRRAVADLFSAYWRDRIWDGDNIVYTDGEFGLAQAYKDLIASLGRRRSSP